MVNVAHSTLTGADLHEPKGTATATSGQVYVANGSGSGAWTTISGLIITGMIADFATPIAPSGWLECDGSAVSRSTNAALFTANTVQQSGTRSAGTAIISGLSSTSNMRAGYFIGGTGITNGTTILSVDSGSQITMSANASSSGTSTVIVSPWALGDGSTTFNLPNVSSAGRFRRSRSASLHIGVAQAAQNQTHTHPVVGDSALASANHTHSVSGTTSTESADHGHTLAGGAVGVVAGTSIIAAGGGNLTLGSGTTGGASVTHTHTYSTTTGFMSADHFHHIDMATGVSGTDGSEARPIGIVVMTCIKT